MSNGRSRTESDHRDDSRRRYDSYGERGRRDRGNEEDEEKSYSRKRDDRSNRDGDRQKSELPDLYAICRGKVHSIRPFGIFVRLNGFRQQGLVHISQVSKHEVTNREDPDDVKIQALASVAGEGEEVWVKIIAVKHEEDGNVKIGCSLKHVSQSDGRDLDPNHLQIEANQSRSIRQVPLKIQDDAVYNVQCTRCGGHGHLKKECYSIGNTKYELVPEGDDDDAALAIAAAAPAATAVPHKAGAGRGLAMVQPAWMTHPKQDIAATSVIGKKRSSSSSSHHPPLPDSINTVEEAKAFIARYKEEKKRKKQEREERHKHEKKRRKEKK